MKEKEQVKVWDIAIRVFHWSLVALFFISYLTGDEGGIVHAYMGYGVIGLLVFRLVWGVIGTKHARFWDFVYAPETTKRYARSLISGKPIHYLGHNPLGGWMVILLLIFLSAVSWSGLEAYGAEGHGPLANQSDSFIGRAFADEDKNEDADESETGETAGSEVWEEIHEVLANLTLILVLLHVAGVLVSSLMHKENLVRAMISGYKNKPPDSQF